MFNHMSSDNRHSLFFAMEEAADLQHAQLGTDHLILGMLCNARSPIYEVLVGEGFGLAAARETVRETHGSDDGSSAADADRDATQVADDRDALKSVGIDLDKVTDAIKRAFGTDITDGWSKRGPDRRGADRRGARGHDGDPRGRRRGPHGRGGPHGHRHGGPHGRGPDCPPWGGPGAGPWGGPDAEWPGRSGRGTHHPFADGEPGSDDSDGGPWDRDPGNRGPENWGPWEHGRGRRGPRGRGGRWGRPHFSRDARAALIEAARIARETDDGHITAERLLLGILAVDDAHSRALIESVTTPERLRAVLSTSV